MKSSVTLMEVTSIVERLQLLKIKVPNSHIYKQNCYLITSNVTFMKAFIHGVCSLEAVYTWDLVFQLSLYSEIQSYICKLMVS